MQLCGYILTFYTLQNELEKSTGINPVEVIKGGSLGHGTAVPGDFDLDLIVYTNCKEAIYTSTRTCT